MIDLNSIPTNPGCYLFKDNSGKIIYIGKAKDLSKRVKSYFQKKDHGEKTKILVSHIHDVDFLITDSEVEALILENNLIKKNKPSYNIDLKDSKRYAYIQITSEEFPRILIARKREENGKLYGPFVSASSRDYVIETLRKTFKIRTCKKLPKKECIRYSIGLCSAPCINKISKTDYENSIKDSELVLKGRIKELINILIGNMKEFSSKQDYERALETRNQIEAIKYLSEKQKMERQKEYDEDILNYVIHENKVYLMLFNARKGIIENKIDFEFNETTNFLDEFLIQYYSEEDSFIPRNIILPKEVDESIEKMLEKISNKEVNIEIPKIGEKKDLLDLVKKNIEINLFGDYDKLEDLSEKLKLNDLPRIIECFDISHLGGTSTVASMVQFRNGKPDKNNYRRFKIKTVEGIDDFSSMKEVIRRRYSRLKEENKALSEVSKFSQTSGNEIVEREGEQLSPHQNTKMSEDMVTSISTKLRVSGEQFALNNAKNKFRCEMQIASYSENQKIFTSDRTENKTMPNLIVIDGGKGQLSSALEELEKLDLKIPIISLAKREEEIFEPGKSSPIILDKKSKALRLLQEIRDEAHRFAISYNRLLRKKKMFE